MSFLHVTDQALTSKTVSALDALTQGAFSAPTSGERSAKLREWLASHPQAEVIQEVYKEMSAKDKGAAKPLREKLDELKRLKAFIGFFWFFSETFAFPVQACISCHNSFLIRV